MYSFPHRLLTWVLIIALFSSCKTYFPPTVYERIKKSDPYDAIIVPGFPFYAEKNNIFMKTRVLWAKHLLDEGFCKNIIFSGGAVYSPYYEAEIMSLYAQKLGVPKERIYVEPHAEHTTENLVYSMKIASKKGFAKVGFATDVYQTTFIAVFLKKMNAEHIDLIPMRFSKIRTFKNIEVAEVDYDKAFDQDFVSILERESPKERLEGSYGNRIFNSSENK